MLCQAAQDRWGIDTGVTWGFNASLLKFGMSTTFFLVSKTFISTA
jgi:hypothetical protein